MIFLLVQRSEKLKSLKRELFSL